MKEADLTQLYSRWNSFGTVWLPYGSASLSESSLVMKGPFSVSIPMSDDEPGPPLSHSPTGSFSGFDSLSTNLEKSTRQSAPPTVDELAPGRESARRGAGAPVVVVLVAVVARHLQVAREVARRQRVVPARQLLDLILRAEERPAEQQVRHRCAESLRGWSSP